MKPLIILVAGGSASGKSTVVDEVLEKAGLNDVLIIKHDDYYKEYGELSFEERKKINYDHPTSLDNDLLISHLNDLVKSKTIEKPLYDFVNHTRSSLTEKLKPKNIIIVEGILVLENPELRQLGDILIFVEADDDTRFIRRMKRDLIERGRSLESIITQYETTVKPMHHKYIKPSKRYADIIIPNDRKHDVAVDLIVSKIKQMLDSLKKEKNERMA
ncbi:uridine kinase [Acholeplasma sp. OttesenSCG-928-E16]|nr:uridine kinase [Acholeplasma sp. OttesenSCG-928-E16]